MDCHYFECTTLQRFATCHSPIPIQELRGVLKLLLNSALSMVIRGAPSKTPDDQATDQVLQLCTVTNDLCKDQ